jgi:spectinomycin phosphotransferase/16S rRNA (guanine(1405)-N(7))-methyltransferase
VLSAPGDLDEGALAGALEQGWGIGVAAMTYRPVGWGSHHWEVTGAEGTRWFVTVDELEHKRLAESESADDGFARLTASLRSAVELKNAGLDFVVAPLPAGADRPAARLGERFAVALYPFVEGTSFGWGDWAPEQRARMAEMAAAVHLAPPRARRHALADEFAVPFRDQMEAGCVRRGVTDGGPYALPLARLLAEHAAPIRQELRRYDDLVAVARSLPARNVLTHGEPHPGNTMLTADGWRLIDWDTALIAPPERDLWTLDLSDGSVLGAYTAVTGVTPVPELLELYRLGWDVKDMAAGAARLMRPHDGNEDDEKTWKVLNELIRRAGQ